MSTAPVIPQNWIYASRQFSMHSDALSENVSVYRPIKETFDSRAAANPVKVIVDSASSFLRPQRSYLSATIQVFNADGTVNATIRNSDIGAMACFRSVTVRAAGKIVDDLPDYPEFLSQQYVWETSNRRKYLSFFEGAGRNDAFANGGTFTVRHHLNVGSLAPLNGNPLPLCLLPNQAVEISMTLNTPQQAFTNAPDGAYFVVSNVRYVAQLVTPSAEYLSSAWKGISSGKSLEYEYVQATQTTNNCSGSTQNNFLLPLANSRVIGLIHRWRDDSKYALTTGDKSLIYDTANLISWRYQIGSGYRLPLTEDWQVEDVLISGALSMSNASTYEDEDVDFANFMTKRFTLRHNWQSADEDVLSALSLIGTDGNVRLITNHRAPAPSTGVSLLTTVFTHRNLLIGNTVDVL